jgi:fructosamine-3-kinase
MKDEVNGNKKGGFGDAPELKQYDSLQEAIRDLFGNERSVVSSRSVSGGDINEARALRLDDGTVLFMKANQARSIGNFLAEARGIRAISAAGAIGTPRILGAGVDGSRSFLLMEYITGRSRIAGYWAVFAHELARMHRTPTDPEIGFGFSSDNYIGSNAQINTPHDSWISFFRSCRLEPQFRAASGCFDAGGRKRIAWLLDHLDRYLTEPSVPALLHGDLWAGNVITGDDGKAWLIDPAAYYGHPEADLAMTELFGGFPGTFYDVYREDAGLDPGYADRRDLYNLYQLLNHLNLFGGGYLPSVDRILRRYAGN